MYPDCTSNTTLLTDEYPHLYRSLPSTYIPSVEVWNLTLLGPTFVTHGGAVVGQTFFHRTGRGRHRCHQGLFGTLPAGSMRAGSGGCVTGCGGVVLPWDSCKKGWFPRGFSPGEMV